jgi:hypothetical protein
MKRNQIQHMKYLNCLLFVILCLNVQAQTEEENVKAVIEKAYIGGIHNGGPVADIRAGFHPQFSMYVLNDAGLKITTLDEWVGNLENPPANKSTSKYLSVTVTGTSASVVLELYRNEKKVFTDNLLLYKFSDGWRIVAKNFYRHPAM